MIEIEIFRLRESISDYAKSHKLQLPENYNNLSAKEIIETLEDNTDFHRKGHFWYPAVHSCFQCGGYFEELAFFNDSEAGSCYCKSCLTSAINKFEGDGT